MTAHLLNIAIGPVQEFIAAARRTRDLWFGSFVLSEISKAAALAVHQAGGKLIFPADGSDLTPGKDHLNVANLILAELPAGVPAATTADRARDAAQKRWMEFAELVRLNYLRVIRGDIWKDQVDDVVEFYAAWVALADGDYVQQRQRVVRLLAGRKNCRDFLPGKGRDGVPKSSLDGLRETILKDDRKNWPPRERHRLRVREGEQLDVVGLVKRTAEGHQAYPSVSRIAADPWLRRVVAAAPQELGALCDACQALANKGILNRIATKRLHPHYAAFPFEGTAVYRSRHPELLEETGEVEAILGPLRNALAAVEHAARAAGLGAEPNPYLSVLVADGDRMGEAISRLPTADAHRRFSCELTRFAERAGVIVREHHGVLVYSGGDDVLAFVPQDRCLACARALYKEFAAIMKQALPETGANLPTLSVGLAVAHFLEDLEDLLEYGRRAEKAAKYPDRDGLAVCLCKRGGAPVEVRQKWGQNLDERLARFAGWFQTGAASNRTPYELHRLADTYDDWPEKTRAEATRRDAIRVIERKRPAGVVDQMAEIAREIANVKDSDDLRRFAAELLIARQLAVTWQEEEAP